MTVAGLLCHRMAGISAILTSRPFDNLVYFRLKAVIIRRHIQIAEVDGIRNLTVSTLGI